MTGATARAGRRGPRGAGTVRGWSTPLRSRIGSWLVTALGAALLATAGAGILAASGWDVRLGPVISLAIAGALAFGLVLEVLGPAQLPTGRRHADPWRLRHAVPYAPPGRDTRVLRDSQAITRELTGRELVPVLHQRLAELAQDRLHTAYRVNLGEPRARELLGERTHDLLTASPQRLGLDDLSNVIERIEAL